MLRLRRPRRASNALHHGGKVADQGIRESGRVADVTGIVRLTARSAKGCRPAASNGVAVWAVALQAESRREGSRLRHAFFRVWHVPRIVLVERIVLLLKFVVEFQMVVAGIVVGFNLACTVSGQ